jgi:hypothetical protein
MSTQTQNNKRGFQGKDSGRGSKLGRGGRGGRSSVNIFIHSTIYMVYSYTVAGICSLHILQYLYSIF